MVYSCTTVVLIISPVSSMTMCNTNFPWYLRSFKAWITVLVFAKQKGSSPNQSSISSYAFAVCKRCKKSDSFSLYSDSDTPSACARSFKKSSENRGEVYAPLIIASRKGIKCSLGYCSCKISLRQSPAVMCIFIAISQSKFFNDLHLQF